MLTASSQPPSSCNASGEEDTDNEITQREVLQGRKASLQGKKEWREERREEERREERKESVLHSTPKRGEVANSAQSSQECR